MNQQDFDKLVRDNLAHLTAEQEANSWEVFTQKWTATEATSAAAVDAFDQAIQNKIGDFSALAMADSWDIFEQKLDGVASTPTVDISELDNAVYNKLYNYQVPYEAATWNILLAKLRKRAWQKVEIAVYKTAELALLCLLFLFGQQFFTTPHLKSFPINSKAAVVAESDKITPTTKEEVIIEASSAIENNAASSAIIENELDRQAVNKTIETKVSSNRTSVPKTAKLDNEIVSVSTLLVEEVDKNLTSITAATTQKTTVTPLLTAPLKPINYQHIHPLTTDQEIATLPSKFDELAVARDDELTEVALITPEKKRTVRFGIFGAGSIDHIFTPKDRLFPIDAYDRYSPGYAGGFSIGKQFLNNRWEVETGLMYISKRYSQQVVVNFFAGNLRNGYEVDTSPFFIEMNMINIPINFRYNVINTNRWKVYSLGGASLQLILQANYDRENLLRASAAPAGGSGNSPNSSNKKFNNGFLVDSDFRNNRYYSYNVGIGLERFVSPRWSIFAQPTYQHTIKAFNSDGIGPNRDRINTMLIMLGAKVGL